MNWIKKWRWQRRDVPCYQNVVNDSLAKRLTPWLLVAVALIVLLPGTATLPLIDRDEPRFAQATLEMMEGEHANWIVPYFNGEYRFDKPILIYWMMRASYTLFGVNEFSARLPSILCAIALALLLWRVGQRWFSDRTGWLAGLGILTCVQIVMHGRSAVADMPMVLAIAVAQYAAFELLQTDKPQHPWRWFFYLYVSLGLGFLAKGPVALIIPLLTLLLHRFVFWRQPLAWRNLRLALGLPLTLLIMAAWGIPAMIATNGLFFQIGVGEHVVERGKTTFQGHGGGYFYYLGTAFLSLFPWIACAGEGLIAVKRNWNAKNSFLLSWLAGTYLVFSLYVTKLPHYVLPAFPAFFLLLGQLPDPGMKFPRWTNIFFWIVIALMTTVASVILFLAFRFPQAIAAPGLAGILLGLIALVIAARAGRTLPTAAALVVVGGYTALFADCLRNTTATTQIAPILQQMPAKAEFAGLRFGEPGLVFYSNHHWNFTLDEKGLASFMTSPGPRLVVCAEREWKIGGPKHNWMRISDYSTDLTALPTSGYRQATVEGLNIARASWVRVRVYYLP